MRFYIKAWIVVFVVGVVSFWLTDPVRSCSPYVDGAPMPEPYMFAVGAWIALFRFFALGGSCALLLVGLWRGTDKIIDVFGEMT